MGSKDEKDRSVDQVPVNADLQDTPGVDCT